MAHRLAGLGEEGEEQEQDDGGQLHQRHERVLLLPLRLAPTRLAMVLSLLAEHTCPAVQKRYNSSQTVCPRARHLSCRCQCKNASLLTLNHCTMVHTTALI